MLNEALKSASNTASSLYDYTQQYTTTIDLTVLETNTDKGKLKTNECGEYLMLLETSSVGSPSLGIPPSSVLVAPKGKQAASSQFTEVELYQYILLREMYSSVVDCKTIALSSNYYIDGKYNEALYFVRSFLQEKSYMGASPSVNAQIRDRLIRGLLESTSPDLAVSAIKKYANLNAYFNASSVLEFAKSYAVAEVGGKIVLGTLGRIAKHPLIKNAVGKILSKFTTEAGDLVRGLTKKDFISTVADFANSENAQIADQAWDLWKYEKWGQLENLFKKYNINGGWPPANGGYNIVDDIPLTKGMKFDRYQEWFKLGDNGKPILGGSFTSPINGSPYNYAQRALRVSENQNSLYYEIEILKDLPIKGQSADVIPWFGQVGKGKQMMFKFQPKGSSYTNFQNLIDEGYIKITIKSSPNGQYINWVGEVFKK